MHDSFPRGFWLEGFENNYSCFRSLFLMVCQNIHEQDDEKIQFLTTTLQSAGDIVITFEILLKLMNVI